MSIEKHLALYKILGQTFSVLKVNPNEQNVQYHIILFSFCFWTRIPHHIQQKGSELREVDPITSSLGEEDLWG